MQASIYCGYHSFPFSRGGDAVGLNSPRVNVRPRLPQDQTHIQAQVLEIAVQNVLAAYRKNGVVTSTHVQAGEIKYSIEEITAIIRTIFTMNDSQREFQLGGRTLYYIAGKELQIFDLTDIDKLQKLQAAREDFTQRGNFEVAKQLSAEIEPLEKQIFIGKGSMGVIYRIPCIHAASLQAIKCANPLSAQQKKQKCDPFQENLREGQLLMQLNVNGDAPGIQIPTAVLEGRSAYVSPIYTMSLYDFVEGVVRIKQKVPLNIKLNGCYQLLSGFMRLNQLGLFHLDTKPDNILLMVGDKENLFHLADFGGDKPYGELLQTALLHDNPLGGMSCTHAYLPSQDVDELKKLFSRARKCQKFKPAALPEIEEQYVALMQKIMVFAWGATLYQLLCCDTRTTQDWPLPYKVTHCADPQSGFDWSAIQATGVSPAFIQGIQAMLHPDAKERPDPTTACARLIQIIESEC